MSVQARLVEVERHAQRVLGAARATSDVEIPVRLASALVDLRDALNALEDARSAMKAREKLHRGAGL